MREGLNYWINLSKPLLNSTISFINGQWKRGKRDIFLENKAEKGALAMPFKVNQWISITWFIIFSEYYLVRVTIKRHKSLKENAIFIESLDTSQGTIEARIK